MRALRILMRIVVGILAAIGLLAVLLAAGIGALGWRVATGEDDRRVSDLRTQQTAQRASRDVGLKDCE